MFPALRIASPNPRRLVFVEPPEGVRRGWSLISLKEANVDQTSLSLGQKRPQSLALHKQPFTFREVLRLTPRSRAWVRRSLARHAFRLACVDLEPPSGRLWLFWPKPGPAPPAPTAETTTPYKIMSSCAGRRRTNSPQA